jgi:DNA polymerase-1
MLLQVHDELVFEVAAGELEWLQAIVVREMEEVVELSVPLDVQIGIGRSWDEAAH